MLKAKSRKIFSRRLGGDFQSCTFPCTPAEGATKTISNEVEKSGDLSTAGKEKESISHCRELRRGPQKKFWCLFLYKTAQPQNSNSELLQKTMCGR